MFEANLKKKYDRSKSYSSIHKSKLMKPVLGSKKNSQPKLVKKQTQSSLEDSFSLEPILKSISESQSKTIEIVKNYMKPPLDKQS